MTKSVIYIAARDSSSEKIKKAKHVCDGKNDAITINLAIQQLGRQGGVLFLLAGTYHIYKNPNANGGIIIDRNNVTLLGEGNQTKLILQDFQDCNVIQIRGVKNIRISNLFIDGNWEFQAIKHKTSVEEDEAYTRSFDFNLSGIKADKFDGDNDFPENVRVKSCTIQNCKALCVYLRGKNMIVENNHLGNARADVVEILNGPGIIRSNIVVIHPHKLKTHVALGSDIANFVSITDNKVYVKEGAKLEIGFRIWQHSFFHSIKRNVLIIEKNAAMIAAVDSRGLFTVILDNYIVNHNAKPVLLSINGLNRLSKNCLINIEIGIRNSYPKYLERWKKRWRRGFLEDMFILIKKNYFYNSKIEKSNHKNTIIERKNILLSN